MAYYVSQSTAVDLGRFDSRAEAPKMEVVSNEKYAKESQKKAVKVPYVKYAVVFLAVFAVLASIIFSYMRLTELTVNTDRLKTSIEKLESDEKALEAKKEQMYTLSYVEEYAKNNLGMIKADKSSIQYIDMSNEENITMADSSENTSAIISGLIKTFNAVVEYMN